MPLEHGKLTPGLFSRAAARAGLSARIVRSQSAGPVESIDVLGVGGVDHLVLADRSRGLTVLAVEDAYARRYESPSQLIRRAAAAEDLLVAMNDSRDRLIVWNPREPAEPAATVVIPHLTGSSIQDLCLVPTVT